MEEQEHLCLSGRPKRMSQKEEVPRERLKSSLTEISRPERPRTAVRKAAGSAGRAASAKRPSSALVAPSGKDRRGQGRIELNVFYRMELQAPTFYVFEVVATKYFAMKGRKRETIDVLYPVQAILKTCYFIQLGCF